MSQTKDTSSKVALPKLFLWNDPTRYQEFPEALSRAEEGRVYTRQEIEQELFVFHKTSSHLNLNTCVFGLPPAATIPNRSLFSRMAGNRYRFVCG